MKEVDKILDLSPMVFDRTKDAIVVEPAEADTPEDPDFNFVRKNYYDIIQQGTAALSSALHVAAESQNPRAYEVVGMLMKNLADVNRQLLQIGEDKQKVKQARKLSGDSQGALRQTVNNTAVFVGSSNDLFRMLKKDK